MSLKTYKGHCIGGPYNEMHLECNDKTLRVAIEEETHEYTHKNDAWHYASGDSQSVQ